MRQPIFIGLRDDIEPQGVFRELPVPLMKAIKRQYKRKGEKPEEVTVDGHTSPSRTPISSTGRRKDSLNAI